ncbi:MAG: TonB family protein [Chitinivibrionales bacterium]|nr:TonB family protein [Chitinivibrionales bacterium]
MIAMITAKAAISMLTVSLLPLLALCTPPQEAPDVECEDVIPERIAGLEVSGPRAERTVIVDLVPIICLVQDLHERHVRIDPSLAKGKLVARITVESTGEVAEVTIVESSFDNEAFLRKVTDVIKDSDFVFRGPSGQDTEIVVPIELRQ